MGQLKIVSGGVKLEGKAFILDSLIASSIRSRTGQPIVIESSRNLTLSTRGPNGLLDNLMYLGEFYKSMGISELKENELEMCLCRGVCITNDWLPVYLGI